MESKVFVDTNVFVYLHDTDEPEKRQRAREELSALLETSTLVVSTQVLQELYVTLTRKLARPMDPENARAAIEDLSKLSVVQIDPPMVLRAIDLSEESRVSLWDALILRAAHEAGCQTVLTEDLQDGWKILGLAVRSPFRGIQESSPQQDSS